MKGVLFLTGIVAFWMVSALRHHPIADEGYVGQWWDRVGVAADHEEMSVTAALRWPDEVRARLQERAQDAADPHSPRYGQWVGVDELRSWVSVPESWQSEAEAYLVQQLGAHRVSRSRLGDFQSAQIRVGEFRAKTGHDVYRYRQRHSGREILRTRAAVPVPESIHVLYGFSEFFTLPSEKRAARADFAEHVRVNHALASDSSPDFARVKSSHTDVEVALAVYCADGSATMDAAQPCSDHPPLVTSLTLTASGVGYDEPAERSVAVGDAHCSGGGSANATVQCNVRVDVPAWSQNVLTAHVSYSDGQVSATGRYADGAFYTATAWVTPRVAYQRYGVPEGFRTLHPENSQAVASFEQQYASTEDLAEFFEGMGLAAPHVNWHGVNDWQKVGPGGEATLDIQWITSIGRGTNTTFWSVSGNPTQGGYILEWARQMLDDSKPPLVTSISYGDTEEDYVLAFGSYDYIDRMEDALLALSSMGRTVLAGSGDAGVTNVGELGNDLGRVNADCSRCRAFYPSDSLYVVSVSASYLTTAADPVCLKQAAMPGDFVVRCEAVGEAAVSVSNGVAWTTGGGFSWRTPRPHWQANAVDAYLAQCSAAELPPVGAWNATGRGYADVAALGHNLLFRFNGQWMRVGGTSASGPMAAALIANLNDLRLGAGKAPLGWINPLLYAMAADAPEAFNDISVGENSPGDVQPKGSPYPTFCPNMGYSAKPGWDPVSGLGSFNFKVWSDIVLNLP